MACKYLIGLSSTKEAQPEEDPSVSARLQRLQNNYEDFGMRRTVEGILVVHDHGHPHILMLQIANAFFKLYVHRTLWGGSWGELTGAYSCPLCSTRPRSGQETTSNPVKTRSTVSRRGWTTALHHHPIPTNSMARMGLTMIGRLETA